MVTEDYYTTFGRRAERGLPPILASSRHEFHLQAIPEILADVVAKMAPERHERMLDIGCGPGLFLDDLAARVASVVAMDHESLLEVVRRDLRATNVELLAGQFPATRPEGLFDVILAYSVLNYAQTARDALAFVDAALALLAPGGRLLLADLPNTDAAKRYRDSSERLRVAAEYEASRAEMRARHPEQYAIEDEIMRNVRPLELYINDAFILALLADTRARGYESYVLPQPRELPFSLSRDDVLIKRRA